MIRKRAEKEQRFNKNNYKIKMKRSTMRLKKEI